MELVDKVRNDSLFGLKKVYVLYEITSSLIVSTDTTKNFFSIMNILKTRLETEKGALLIIDSSSGKKNEELLFGINVDDIKDRYYNISSDVIQNVVYTRDIVFLVESKAGVEAKGAQMMNFIERTDVRFFCIPILDANDDVTAILVVDRLFDDDTLLEKDVFFLRSIAVSISKNMKLKQQFELEKNSLIDENKRLKKELSSSYKLRNIVTTNEKVLKIIETVKQVAKSNIPILLSGEVGTGKELIAKAIHYNSPRVGSAFSKIHCGALPEPALATELFGYEVDVLGAGQHQSKPGKLETNDGGTIYIENIESMSLPLQARLLRYLADGEYETEGVTKLVKSNTRIIVGTTKDLEELVKEEQFLSGLFYELNLINILMPSLKERQEDIPVLVKHFIKKFSKESSKRITDVTPDVMEKFMHYDWPGNISELVNCIKRMIVMSNSKILDESLLPNSLTASIEEKEKRYEGSVDEVIDSILKDKLEKIISFFGVRNKKKSVIHKRITDNVDKILIELALRKCNHVQKDAAAFLGINRNTLRTKVEKLKVNTSKLIDQKKSGKTNNLHLPF